VTVMLAIGLVVVLTLGAIATVVQSSRRDIAVAVGMTISVCTLLAAAIASQVSRGRRPRLCRSATHHVVTAMRCTDLLVATVCEVSDEAEVRCNDPGLGPTNDHDRKDRPP
jgi:hypothetical protein